MTMDFQPASEPVLPPGWFNRSARVERLEPAIVAALRGKWPDDGAVLCPENLLDIHHRERLAMDDWEYDAQLCVSPDRQQIRQRAELANATLAEIQDEESSHPVVVESLQGPITDASNAPRLSELPPALAETLRSCTTLGDADLARVDWYYRERERLPHKDYEAFEAFEAEDRRVVEIIREIFDPESHTWWQQERDAQAANEMFEAALNSDWAKLSKLAWIHEKRRETGDHRIDEAPLVLPEISQGEAFEQVFGDRGESMAQEAERRHAARRNKRVQQMQDAPPAANDDAAHAPGPVPCELIAKTAAWVNEDAPREQPMLALGAVLAMAGALSGRTHTLAPFDTRTNVYIIGLAPTGGGKDHARGRVRSLVKAIGHQDDLLGQPKSDSALVDKMSDNPQRLGLWDELGFFNSENSSAQKSGGHTAGLKRILMEIFSSSNATLIGNEYARSNQDRGQRVDVLNPCLCIYGTSTQEAYYAGCVSGDVKSGDMNRWLVVEGDQNVKAKTVNFGRRGGRSEPPQDLIDAWQRVANVSHPDDGNLSNLAASSADGTIALNLIDVGVDDGANAILNEVAQEQDERAQNKSDNLSALWARYAEYVSKIAMILAITDNPEAPVITSAHADWSRDFVRWCVKSMVDNVRARVADNQTEREMNKLLDVLRECGDWMSRTELSRRVRGVRKRERDALMSDLVDVQRVVEVSVDQDTTPPTIYYRYVG